jgi:chromosome segregation protein
LRLTHIKLAGFKSFVDPTAISIPGDLVGVVGPNGCGKSNIIDAVRWVLGESKASALRGESMQDVIFTGSASRKPVSRASVELKFDNKLGKAAGQWSSYAEISIKRVVHRDGDSVYSINNMRVRRRDIADLFLGTGIGGKGYAIIEQGMISRVIEAKPQELKVFLEEAAGISKYRERRHETERRLIDTQKNLLRVEDICQELRKQLQHLEAQAEVARQFQALQQKLHHTQNLLWLAHKQKAEAQHTQAEEEIQRIELKLEAETTFLQKTKKELEEIRHRHYAASDTLHESQGTLYASNAEITRVEQEIKHLRDTNQRLLEHITEVEKQLAENSEQKKNALNSLEHWNKEFEQAHLAHELSVQKNSIENEKLPVVERDFRTRQESLNDCQRNLLMIEQAGQLEENHLTHALKTLQQLESRQSRLEQELNSLPQQDFNALSVLQSETKNLELTLSQKKTALIQAEKQLPHLTNTKDEIIKKQQTLQQAATQAQAKFDALQRLQRQLESNQALNKWMTGHQFDVLPRLWQNIQVAKGWEDALEAILRERLNSTEFDRLEVIEEWMDDLPPGKWTLFESVGVSKQPVNTAKEKQLQKHHRQSILEYLSCSHPSIKSVLDEWLCNIFVVSNIQTGLSERGNLAASEILVTPEGHIFTRHSLTFFSPDSQLHGVLARKQELNQISADIKNIEKNLNQEKTQLLAAEQACAEAIETIKIYRQECEQLQHQHHNSQLQMIKYTQLAERTDQRRKQIDKELIDIVHQLNTERLHQQNAQKKITSYAAEIEELKKMLQQNQVAWETTDQLLTRQRQLAQNTMHEVQATAFHRKNCQNKKSETQETIQIIDENAVRLADKLENLIKEKNTIDEDKLNFQLQECLSQRISHETSVSHARDILEEAANDLQKIEEARMTSEQKLHPLQESINKARLKEQEARITENQFIEQLNAANADMEALLPALGKMKPAALQDDLERLNDEIQALGAVNLAALNELQTLRAREAYLDSQLCDLREAVATLESVIRQIDRETRERLLETYNALNNNLSEVFPAIFGGGQAKLILNGDEILDSGVQLTAQPPGKKNSSIQLLSGGEKALTALALVFSMFRLNPAPFCLLDEVDAPLDDSNTSRFCDLVKKMSEQTQFLFISHNKITMEMAQQLIGITMQEQGVSRVVAVDIDEAIKLGNAAIVA